jgi:hypothetical protein
MTILRRAYALARWLVRLEIGIWRSLFLLAARRVPGRGPGVRLFPYAKEVAPLLYAFIGVSALELVVVHLILPWETVRTIALVISLWGLLWMIGYLASLKVFQHLVGPGELRVRYGTAVDVRVPWEAVADVRLGRHRVPTGKAVHVLPADGADGGVALHVSVLKRTRIELVLHGPTMLELPDGPQEVTAVRLDADDPKALVAAAREHLRDPSGREAAPIL